MHSYKSFFDATYQTFKNEGIMGFYRGLGPTLAKVVPAVSISYVVYDHVRFMMLFFLLTLCRPRRVWV